MASVSNTRVKRYENGRILQKDDLLAVEEPLEVRIGYGKPADREQERLAVTMRTPGHDEELALGMLFSEGIVRSLEDIVSIHYCETVKPEEMGNVIRVELQDHVAIDWKKLHRHIYSHAACGVCGKTSIDAVMDSCRMVSPLSREPGAELISSLPGKLRTDQLVFEHTGGLHAVGLFNLQGDLLCVREDVGRHNALDKLVGNCLNGNSIPLHDHIVVLSGRISYELVQKSARAGIPMICAVGAPSSLAVTLAREAGISLIGFVREDYWNQYTFFTQPQGM